MNNSLQRQRRIDFADRSVNIDYQGERSQRLIDYVFSDIPTVPVVDAHIALTLHHTGPTSPDNTSLNYTDQFGTKLASDNTSDGAVANALLGDVIYHLADRCDKGMVFHAGAVKKNDVCIILPGQSGAGKTSVTAWFTQSGYHYLTDEVVYVRCAEDHLTGFTRPFNFKTPALTVVRRDLGIDAADFPDYACGFATLIPHRQFNDDFAGHESNVHSVVFPQYTAESDGELTRISSAQTALGLMACLVNGRNLDEHGFRDVSALARQVTGYQLRYSHFSQLPSLMATHGL